MTTCAEYTADLAEARAALKSVLTGGKIKSLRSQEKGIEYFSGNLGDLRAYVQSLQARVDACNGVTRAGRALRFLPVDD